MSSDEEGEKSPEILPPEPERGGKSPSEDIYLALVNNYTNRPDLLIAELEKHDPGFVKRMNASAEAHASRLRDGKFGFGKHQAYVALFMNVAAVLVVLFCLYLVVKNDLGFWSMIGLVIFFSVAQSGSFGVAKIIDAASRPIERFRGQAGE